jgi:hypothetical protein
MSSVCHVFQPRASAVAAATLCLWSTWAGAVLNGVIPSNGQIRNPYDAAQELTVWKLVGRAGVASGVQINRQWILTARHNSEATFFQAKQWPSSVTFSACYPSFDAPTYSSTGRTDFMLCRLSTPVDTFATFPPLVAAPTSIQSPTNDKNEFWDTATRSALRPSLGKYGTLMGYGFAVAGEGLVITDFGAVPWGYEPVKGSNAPSIPKNSGGDSGGAAYWISPSSHEPALVGLLTGAAIMPNGVTYFTADAVQWIKDKITQIDGGATSVTTLTASQHHPLPTNHPAPELVTPPSVQSSDGSSANVKASWGIATATPAITSYTLSLGSQGALINQWQHNVSQTLPALITGLAAGPHLLCVRAINAIGPALPAFATPTATAETPNCTAFDTTPPGALTGLNASATVMSSTLSKVTFNWTLNTPLAAKTSLQQVLTYASGPASTKTTEVTGTTYSVIVTRGAKVCVTAKPFSGIGVTASAQSTCVTTN